MKVGLGILTYNVFETGRVADLAQTLSTTTEEHCGHPRQRVILTNGSTDGTAGVVRAYDEGVVLEDCDSRVWYGNTQLIERLKHNDLIVLSADDLAYRPGWLAKLVRFVEAVPEATTMGLLGVCSTTQIPLASAYMEPVWGWNQPLARAEHGGEVALVRESVCGSSWAFRPSDWFDWMGPFQQTMPGEDLLVCQRLRARGLAMAALDLAEHVGQERSAWGNKSHLSAQPLDRKRWGLDDHTD